MIKGPDLAAPEGAESSRNAVDAYPEGVVIGMDVGSTTVKAVVMDPKSKEILWSDYQRHETKQPEKCNEFLDRIEAEFPFPKEKVRIFITGSGGGAIADYIGAKFVQEVNAVSLAVENAYPDAGSVVELGGQDAKIIIWVEDPKSGQKRKLPSMNDKCAGGTGAVIDKINAKLKLTGEQLQALNYFGVKLHPVAGKCGVFAETDINGLQKQGVPSQELMASLFEAIVQQNLSVLTRGNTLRPLVILLGGPCTFIPAMQDAWKHNIPKVWEERKVALPEGVDPQDLIIVPDNAQYYAAIGSVLYGLEEDAHIGRYEGKAPLEEYIKVGRAKLREATGDSGLSKNEEELQEFIEKFTKKPFEPVKFQPGQEVKGFIGVDGGSTSTKCVLMDENGTLLTKAYQLSKGNPLEDTKEVLAELRTQVEEQGATLSVQGLGTTGYAKDILKDSLGADVALVETVAHTMSALHYYEDVDVIVDVGGQDIKVIILHNRQVKDFRLNTQCSAGNGYFLQSTGGRFGYDVTEFADIAFKAERLPIFSYGCAVFMESDIVNFQQLGWSAEEIMAGLAKVLPKNIWLYVVQEPNLQKFGTNFILQGGTQHNLAAVKSQYDFISEKVPGANITVHDYCGESGAIGAALDAIRVVKQREGKSEYLGLEATQELTFSAKRDESTRCHFCKNKCLRTFIDTETSAGSRRFIIATCEKGTVENVDDMKGIKAEIQQIKKANPNFVEVAAKAAFRSFNPQKVYEADEGWLGKFNEWLVGRGRLEEDTAAEAVAKDVAASALPAANNNNGAAAGGNGAKPKRVPAKVQKLMDGGLSFEEATKKVEEARAAFNGNGNAPANGNGAKPKAKAAPPAVSEKASSPQNGDARATFDRKPQAKKASRPTPKTPVKKSAVPDSRIHPIVDRLSRGRLRSRREIMRYRETVKVGMPRVLNMYSTAPLWSAYMESLGVRPNHIAWSDYTEEQMWKEGSRRGSIDQCFPSKVAVAHIHNLVFKKRGIDVILFPAVINLPSWLDNALKHDACPTVQATPAVCKAAFTKESDIFAERGITFYDPPFHMNELSLFERECYNFFSKWLGVTPAENERAIEQGWEAMRKFHHDLQRVPAREVLEQLERENRVGVVLLGRPYHNDPGLNHEILEQVQKLGYPVFTIASLPIDGESLEPLFGEDVRRGDIVSGTDVTDVWKNCYSENSSQKVWAAKYVARHPNLVAIDLSSFKCGHDAPMYSVVESTVEYSGTPYFTFHDIDENKPTGSIKIRVETMDYFLKRYQEDMGRMNALEGDLQEKLEARKRELMAQLGLSMERAPQQEHVGEGLIQIQTSSSREAAVLA